MKLKIIISAAAVALALLVLRSDSLTLAFVGPQTGAGVGTGAIGVDASNNLSIGTPTTLSNTKLLIKAPDNSSANYALQVQDSGASVLFSVRNDGAIFAPGLTGAAINSNNVSAGQFGLNTGGGNYSFPATITAGGTDNYGGRLTVIKNSVYNNESQGGVYISTGVNGQPFLTLDTDSAAGFASIQSGARASGWGAKPLILQPNGGKVGIGALSNPATPLDVAGNATVRGNLLFKTITNTGNLFINDNGAGTATINNSGNSYLNITSAANTNISGGTFTVGYSAAAVTGGVAAFNGNVGIGTTVPSQKLEVTGNTSSTKFCLSGSCISTWPAGGSSAAGGSGNIQFNNSGAFGGSANLFWDNANSRLGIGTAAPSTNLEISQNSGLKLGDAFVSSGGSQYAHFASNAWFNGTSWVIPNAARTSALVQMIDNQIYFHRTTAPGSGVFTLSMQIDGSGTLIVGSGAGKITAGTYDPVYDISGEKFATYLPGMTGQKEETAGVVTCRLTGGNKCEAIIDFASAARGSDLWLFRQIIDDSGNFEKVTILLTPSFDGRVWYEKDKQNNRIIINSTGEGEVSYRLTGSRFDAAHWPNRSEDQSIEGLKVKK